MYPEEREYRVGPSGFTMSRDSATVRYPAGALVWLARAPLTADLTPTGERRRYETKVSAVGDPIIQRERKGRR